MNLSRDATMKYKLFKSSERGTKDIGWLRSNFIFSFSDYYDPDKSAFGTLITFNDDFVQPGKGFGTSSSEHGNNFHLIKGQYES